MASTAVFAAYKLRHLHFSSGLLSSSIPNTHTWPVAWQSSPQCRSLAMLQPEDGRNGRKEGEGRKEGRQGGRQATLDFSLTDDGLTDGRTDGMEIGGCSLPPSLSAPSLTSFAPVNLRSSWRRKRRLPRPPTTMLQLAFGIHSHLSLAFCCPKSVSSSCRVQQNVTVRSESSLLNSYKQTRFHFQLANSVCSLQPSPSAPPPVSRTAGTGNGFRLLSLCLEPMCTCSDTHTVFYKGLQQSSCS